MDHPSWEKTKKKNDTDVRVCVCDTRWTLSSVSETFTFLLKHKYPGRFWNCFSKSALYLSLKITSEENPMKKRTSLPPSSKKVFMMRPTYLQSSPGTSYRVTRLRPIQTPPSLDFWDRGNLRNLIFLNLFAFSKKTKLRGVKHPRWKAELFPRTGRNPKRAETKGQNMKWRLPSKWLQNLSWGPWRWLEREETQGWIFGVA